MTVRRAAVAVIVVIVAVAVVFALRFGDDPRAVDSPLIGERVPEVELPYLEQTGSVDLRDLRGGVVVVNFWASWCVPCRAEHKALLRAAAAYGDAGVRVLGVVYQDDPDSAKAFLDAEGRGYDVVTDPGSRAAIEFGLFGVPETFFIDARGRVAAKVSGPVTNAQLTKTIDRILRRAADH